MLTGAATRFLNYERRTTAVAENVEGIEILEYEAPGWDPFPHTVRITVRTGDAVTIVGTYSGARIQTERFGLRDGEERLQILPNE